MAKRGGVEIGKVGQVASFAHTAAASGNPAGHATIAAPIAGCSPTYYPVNDARGSSAGFFNWNLSGTFAATVVVDKTFDDGVSWVAASDNGGTAISGTAAKSQLARELEQGVGYRSRCTAFTSGTATSRFGQ